MQPSDAPQAGSDPFAFLVGGGEMGERTRTFDWSATPVGPVERWPQALKIAVRIMLGSRYAMWMGWGPEFTFFYNDAYGQMTLGPKHPWALGKSAREVWREIWADIGPRAEGVIATGEAKAQCVERTVNGPVTPRLPASFLQLHRHVELYLDRGAAARL